MSVGVMKDYKLKTKRFTRLPYTVLVLELEHLKIETRLISEMIGSPRTRKLGKKILQKTKKRGKKQIFTSEETRGGRLL